VTAAATSQSVPPNVPPKPTGPPVMAAPQPPSVGASVPAMTPPAPPPV
jgi:hypothetical protein